ncbi:MAG: GNAT family N-acetyltransferase [Pseudomonadota bacterium]
MALRLATPDDATAIRDLTRAAYAKWIALIGREPRPMTADYEQAVHHHRFDLLMIGGRLTALIETIVHADHLLIENVAVEPSCQGCGYGRMLIAHAEQLASSSKLGEVRLYTNQRFADNISLYIRLGYRVDREEVISDGIVVHMSKKSPKR